MPRLRIEIAFNRVGMNVAVNIFANAMIDGPVKDEFAADFLSRATFVCHNKRGRVDLCRNDWTQCCGCDRRDMMRFNATATLDQCEDSFLTSTASSDMLALIAVLVFLKSADKRFVNLNLLALATKRYEWAATFAKCFADAMHQKPCGFQAHA